MPQNENDGVGGGVNGIELCARWFGGGERGRGRQSCWGLRIHRMLILGGGESGPGGSVTVRRCGMPVAEQSREGLLQWALLLSPVPCECVAAVSVRMPTLSPAVILIVSVTVLMLPLA